MKYNLYLSILLLIVLICFQEHECQEEEDFLDHNNPIRNAAEDEIKDLPGLNDAINFRQYSGYLPAEDGEAPKKFLHYWFVESQSNPTKDPILLWLNGGPGCSSMAGLFTELGPYSVNGDGASLKLNKFSWNKVANVLFLESPAGVGFSYSRRVINVHTDDTTATENLIALRSFMNKFPQYRNNSLYLSGESYAGVYLPTLGVLVDADKELNLKGIAIGNGYLDVAKLTDSLIFFGYNHGLIGLTLWKRLSKHCCAGLPPARESCKMSSTKNVLCHAVLVEIQYEIMGKGLNPYNIYGKCSSATRINNNTHRYSRREQVHKAMISIPYDTENFSDERPFHVFQGAGKKEGVEPPCTNDHILISYLNNQEVRKAIHIPKGVQGWDTCSLILYIMQYPKLPGGLTPQIQRLIASKRNLALLIYNGDVDAVCNFLGDEWFVEDLGRKVIKDYSTWKVDKQIAGYVKHFDGITFATVRGSGHMVPGDRPQEALQMISLFLNATTHNTLL